MLINSNQYMLLMYVAFNNSRSLSCNRAELFFKYVIFVGLISLEHSVGFILYEVSINFLNLPLYIIMKAHYMSYVAMTYGNRYFRFITIIFLYHECANVNSELSK